MGYKFSRPELRIQTAKTASFTAEPGKLYPVNLGSVTADLVLTFPSSPNTNDKFGVYVSATHSSGGTSTDFIDRPFFCIEPANTTSINGVSYAADSGDGSGVYGLWQNGESFEFIYDGSTWRLWNDGRIPFKARLSLGTADSITNVTPTNVEYDTDISDIMGMHSTSTNTERVIVKRAGDYQVNALFRWGTSGVGIRFGEVRNQDSTILAKYRINATGAGDEGSPVGNTVLSAGDYVYAKCYQSSGSGLDLTSIGNAFNVTEVL